MPTSLQVTRTRLSEHMVRLLWCQWSTMGVAGYPDDLPDWLIDPEALLLATARFGRFDARLLDESLDWLILHGRRINLQRLQNLHRDWPLADPRILAAFGEILSRQASSRKWGKLITLAPSDPEPEPLFLTNDGSPSIMFGEPEPTFALHGLLRGKLEHRAMSQPPDPSVRQNLHLTLRALLGVNARAEILLYLLTHESGHPAAIARATGYFSKSIQQNLNDMEESGHIRSYREGREKSFNLHHADWHFLCPPGETPFPRWIDWMPLFAAVGTLFDTLSIPDLDQESIPFQAIQLREALEAARPALKQARLIHQMKASPELRGQELIDAVCQDLLDLLSQLTPPSAGRSD